MILDIDEYESDSQYLDLVKGYSEIQEEVSDQLKINFLTIQSRQNSGILSQLLGVKFFNYFCKFMGPNELESIF